MDSSKPWYQSTGVWGGLASLSAGLAGFFGYAISVEEQQAIANSLSQATVAVSTLVAIAGGLMSLIGRIRASKTIR